MRTPSGCEGCSRREKGKSRKREVRALLPAAAVPPLEPSVSESQPAIARILAESWLCFNRKKLVVWSKQTHLEERKPHSTQITAPTDRG